MKIKRWLRHLATGQLALRFCFPKTTLDVIEQAIRQSEMQHGGEICFAVEIALNTVPLFKNQSARERAIDVFSQLRVWDTEHNNGVLIYVLLADRDVEIVADRGINAKISESEWEAVCHAMESAFRQRQFETGVIDGIQTIGRHLATHFPLDENKSRNELPNKPVVL